MGIVRFFLIKKVRRWQVGSFRRTKGRRKRECIALCAVRFLFMPLVITLPTKRKRCVGGRCPYIACLSFGGSRRSDIMGIGQKNAIDIPACEEMQGMNGSSIVGSGGQPSLLKLSMSLPMVLRLQPKYSANSTSEVATCPTSKAIFIPLML